MADYTVYVFFAWIHWIGTLNEIVERKITQKH